jgi:hypothetical protein
MKTYNTRYKIWAAVEGEPARLHDGISYQFQPHLVPAWEEGPDGTWRRPERIIPLQKFGPRATPGDARGADFEITQPVPRAVWSGPASDDARAKYGVHFRPPAREWL